MKIKMKSKRHLSTLLALALVLSTMMGTTAFAKESVTCEDAVVDEAEQTTAEARSIVGPDGNTYENLGTATRAYPIEALLRRTVTTSDGYHIVFYCPNNNKKDLVQGTLTASPVLGGLVEEFPFTNFGNEIRDIDLSNLSNNGPYILRVKAYVYGTSNKCDVYYRTYQTR